MSAVTAWARAHVGTIAAWGGMAATMLVGTASQWTMLQAQHAQQAVRIERVEAVALLHTADIVEIRSDVRSISESVTRLDAAVTRQEAATRQIDRLTVRLETMVSTLGDR